MVEICLKEQLAKQILYLFPTLMNQVDGEVDHEVFGSNNAIYNAVHYRTSEITGAVLEDRDKIENIWSLIEWTLRTDVGKNMSYYIKWFRS